VFQQELDTSFVPTVWKGVEYPGDNLIIPEYVPPEIVREDTRSLLEIKGIFPLNRDITLDTFVPTTWSFGKVKLGKRDYPAHLYVRGIVQEPKVIKKEGVRVPARFYVTSFPNDQIRAGLSKEEVDGWSGRETVVRVLFTPEEASLIQFSAVETGMDNQRQKGRNKKEHIIYQAA
jgi:hypothetical protein